MCFCCTLMLHKFLIMFQNNGSPFKLEFNWQSHMNWISSYHVNCLTALCCRWFKLFAHSYVKVPLFGAVSYLTIAVSPFCITFAVLWGVYRDLHFAWIGQDVLVRMNICHMYLVFNFAGVLRPFVTTDIHIMYLFLVTQGIALIMTVIQIVRIPNLKVMTSTLPPCPVSTKKDHMLWFRQI